MDTVTSNPQPPEEPRGRTLHNMGSHPGRRLRYHWRLSKNYLYHYRKKCYAVLLIVLAFIAGVIFGPRSVVFEPVLPSTRVEIQDVYQFDENWTQRELLNITITAYDNTLKQADGTYNVTSTGYPVSTGVIAVSRDLWKTKVFPGDVVCVHRLHGRCFRAMDSMNARWTRRLDVYDPTLSKSLKMESEITVHHLIK